jgi:hypothetical protein
MVRAFSAGHSCVPVRRSDWMCLKWVMKDKVAGLVHELSAPGTEGKLRNELRYLPQI